ncbi:hypothetical protein D1872_232250 [compost metagenome]
MRLTVFSSVWFMPSGLKEYVTVPTLVPCFNGAVSVSLDSVTLACTLLVSVPFGITKLTA